MTPAESKPDRVPLYRRTLGRYLNHRPIGPRPHKRKHQGALEVAVQVHHEFKPDVPAPGSTEGNLEDSEDREQGRLNNESSDCTPDRNAAGSADTPAALVPGALCDAPCNAPRNAVNWAGARFAETTTINSDSPDQLDCMGADDFEPTDNVGSSDSTTGPSGVAEASNNTYLRPSVPHAPWFRVIDARRKKVVAEEASATPPAAFH
ncbi:hypothetical protein MRX96_057828 [Rhipicephalus microplus]